MPNIPSEYLPDYKLVINKAIVPTEDELKNNPRARSAKLRVIEKIKWKGWYNEKSKKANQNF